MIEIVSINFKERLNTEDWELCLQILPKHMQEKVLRYRRWEDQHANLLGKLLLLNGLIERGYPANSLEMLKTTDFGKPYLEDGIHFNISHSGHMVICGFSEHSIIGVDIEEKKPLNLQEFDGIFSDLEWNSMLALEDPTELFYRYWTTKESVIKAVGKGLSLVLKEVTVTAPDRCSYKNVDYNIRLIPLEENYATAFASTCHEAYVLKSLSISELKKLRSYY